MSDFHDNLKNYHGIFDNYRCIYILSFYNTPFPPVSGLHPVC